MSRITPLVQRTKEMLQENFQTLPYLSLIPSERNLCKQFKVSRPTIRKALSMLEEEELLQKIQGKGSVYLGNKISIDYSYTNKDTIGLSQLLQASGKKIKSKVIEQSIIYADVHMSEILNLKEGDLIFKLKRLRYINKDMQYLTTDYIPLTLYPDIIKIDFTNTNLLSALEAHNVIPYKEDKQIECKHASQEEALYLALPINAPLSVVHIRTYDKNDRILQYATMKGDAYKASYRIISRRTK